MIKLATEERDRVFYYRAVDLAKLSGYAIRVGAFAAHNGKPLCGAFNTIRNSANNAPFGSATYHAEFNCLRMVPDRLLSRITLYIARIDKLGNRMPSKPCPRCSRELAIRQVREVVYFDGEFIVKRKYP